MELEKSIDYIINNKSELLEKVKEWEEQKFKVKTNEEYDLLVKRITLVEAILYSVYW